MSAAWGLFVLAAFPLAAVLFVLLIIPIADRRARRAREIEAAMKRHPSARGRIR